MNQSKPLSLLATTFMLACFGLTACATESIGGTDPNEANGIVAPAAGLECSTTGAGCTCRWSSAPNATTCNNLSRPGTTMRCCLTGTGSSPASGYACECSPAPLAEWRCTQSASSSNCGCNFNRKPVYSDDRYVTTCAVDSKRGSCCASATGCSCSTSSTCAKGYPVASCSAPPPQVTSAGNCPGGTSALADCRGAAATSCDPVTCTGASLECCTSAGCVSSHLECRSSKCTTVCEY